MTASQLVPDPLNGWTLEEAKAEQLRLVFRAEQLTVSLRELVMTSVVRANVERERDQCEYDAHFLAVRIAEAEGQAR